ncbi:J domain-containing protein [Photobacterium leiognathi]|uniref:J domain-containing protein n=1 Tax=Photobacterium leiognathi TaxID=553611 RepID=UPI002735F804|nr:J domain-containing protein [Photobacterium leiognathi]
MTTFHDLLGTTEHTTPSEIKKRYKLLSHRLHPDKLGSGALMQLVTLAYNEILQGNGSKICESVINEKLILTKKYAQKLKQELESQRTKSVDLEQQILDLRKSLNKEKNENKNLAEQLKNETAKTLVHDISPAEINKSEKSPRFKYGIVYSSILLNILLAVLVITLFNAQSTPLVDENNTNDVLVTKIEQPQPKLIEQKQVKVAEPAKEKTAIEVINIELTNSINQWKLSRLTANKPYIAIRNKAGSYIVSSCDKRFYYYANLTQQRAHLPPNLAFIKHYQNFSVYHIGYGMGSQKDHWLNSQSIKVNREYFSNVNFEQMQQALKSRCVI